MIGSGEYLFRCQPPYNFALSAAYFRGAGFDLDSDSGRPGYTRVFEYDGVPVIIRIPIPAKKTASSIRVTWRSREAITSESAWREFLRSVFYLHVDLDSFRRDVDDPVMRRLIEKYSGLRPVLIPDLFETAAWAIIGQQVNGRFASVLKERLIGLVNRTCRIDGRDYQLFPVPADIARIDPRRLRRLQLSERKSEYLLGLAGRIAEGRLDLFALRKMAYEEAMETLIDIRGIGVWTANYILVRGAGHPDAFPFGDSGIYRAVAAHYMKDRKPAMEYLQKLSDRWRPYRSLAACYLWYSL